MAGVLLADDSKEVLVMLSSWLKYEDKLTVDTAPNGAAALDFLKTYSYDVVVLDWEMPGVEGVEVCRQFRQLNNQTPVIMLTGRNTTEDKIFGLDAGADDYLTKPFSAEELSARIRALLRRQVAAPIQKLECSGIVLEPDSHAVTANGMPLALSPTEFNLLAFFIQHKSEIFSPEALVARVWGDSDEASVAGVRTTIKRFRRKLEAALGECPLETVRGSGYLWKA